MAIGIDRREYRRLLERLDELIRRDKDPVYWQHLKKELTDAHEHSVLMIRKAELSAADYNRTSASIRSVVSSALRHLGKSKK